MAFSIKAIENLVFLPDNNGDVLIPKEELSDGSRCRLCYILIDTDEVCTYCWKKELIRNT